MVEPLYAHSPSRKRRRWHTLEDHLSSTGELAAGFAEQFATPGHRSSLVEVARRVGQLHDVGKAACGWQRRLRVAAGSEHRVGGDHKLAGVVAAAACGLGRMAWAIEGHHGGLTNSGELRARLEDPDRDLAAEEEATAAVRTLLGDSVFDDRVVVPDWCRADAGAHEMALRMVYSALVDADWLDTSAHANDRAPRLTPQADMDRLWAAYQDGRKHLLAERASDKRPSSPLDALREEVWTTAVNAATGPGGLWRLPAPTGTGKTITAAGWALRHAAEHQLNRVVVAVPYISVTEQNAAVYRRLLGDTQVIEHHSQIDLGAAGWRARGAMENWDAPFIVTTTAQLFDSLHARRPGPMRKIHRLARAVVVLDEVQTLPERLLVPYLSSLRILVERFGTSVLLASATQPEYQHLTTLGDVTVRDIALPDKVDGWYRRTRDRVVYTWQVDPRPTLDDIAHQAATSPTAALLIINTTADARTLHAALTAHAAPGRPIYHLSTRMCPAHRRQTLADVKAALANDEPVLLAATQLVEAGVDIDFPTVYRAVAPADSWQQAAGRANREALGSRPGRVIIFDPADGHTPDGYDTRIAIARRHMGPRKTDPDDQAALAAYYRDLYDTLRVEVASIGARIQRWRHNLDYLAVADGPLLGITGTRRSHAQPPGKRDRTQACRLIVDDTVPTVVHYGDDDQRSVVAASLTAIRSRTADQDTYRRLQPYLVQLPASVARRATANLDPIAGNLCEWTGPYDSKRGIEG